MIIKGHCNNLKKYFQPYIFAIKSKFKKIIKIVPIKEKVKKVIETCIMGVNYWVNNGAKGVNWEKEILQPVPWFDDAAYKRNFLKLIQEQKKH